jgi:hypothetical protein
MFGVAEARLLVPLSRGPARIIAKGNPSGMLAFVGPLPLPLPDVSPERPAVIFGESAQHLEEEHSLRPGVV